MATSIVKQSILFIPPDGTSFNQEGIFADSLIQSLAQNSVGNDLTYAYISFKNLTGGVWSTHGALEISCFVAPSFVATIQANMPALQAAWPTYTVVTYSASVFG